MSSEEIRWPREAASEKTNEDINKERKFKDLISEELDKRVSDAVEHIRLDLIRHIADVRAEGMSPAATDEILRYLDDETQKFRDKLKK